MDRDEMGRFVAQVKAKGDAAMADIAKAKGDSAPFAGKETLAEESSEHGVALKAPLAAHKGEETPEEEAAEEKEISKKYGAQKGKYKPWGFEAKKGW